MVLLLWCFSCNCFLTKAWFDKCERRDKEGKGGKIEWIGDLVEHEREEFFLKKIVGSTAADFHSHMRRFVQKFDIFILLSLFSILHCEKKNYLKRVKRYFHKSYHSIFILFFFNQITYISTLFLISYLCLFFYLSTYFFSFFSPTTKHILIDQR